MCLRIRKTSAPCDTCLVPLAPENKDAIKVWQQVRCQVITSPAGQPDVDVKAVIAVISLYPIADPCHCFEQVVGLMRFFLSEQ